jgi:hypothetical protein
MISKHPVICRSSQLPRQKWIYSLFYLHIDGQLAMLVTKEHLDKDWLLCRGHSTFWACFLSVSLIPRFWIAEKGVGSRGSLFKTRSQISCIQSIQTKNKSTSINASICWQGFPSNLLALLLPYTVSKAKSRFSWRWARGGYPNLAEPILARMKVPHHLPLSLILNFTCILKLIYWSLSILSSTIHLTSMAPAVVSNATAHMIRQLFCNGIEYDQTSLVHRVWWERLK